ncbi:MAG: sugar ABC transporter ATP-binding protein [Melioribacteraceae bacterium]|nr:sugar ABC transporter ATP-binding protein [Melioribacteraceae bacterium]MCF8354709.1 sugar ABC transporter ATP-binding protein [Melioribacteraceae bacterium]MCF8393164.1 sugar ABC transporter ATP-binding protein [Melioribacteraceae bacterium]MCF8418067.1 sugar ABC transporter ATP-binding protein [Melioribacteraceae bacterium]
MLSFSEISKSYSGNEVLHDVSFDIDYGEITALVGENGAGKSTLMKVLSGVIKEYTGKIIVGNEVREFNSPREAELAGISIIHQELNLIEDLTIAENIFLGREPVTKFGLLDFEKLYEDADEILRGFEFPFSSKTKVSDLNVGWQQIVEIARVFSIDSRIIIMDEPTSALTESEIRILFEKIKILKNQGKAIIFISHRLEEVFELADEIVVLSNGCFVGKFKNEQIIKSELISKMIGKKHYETQRTINDIENEILLNVDGVDVYNKKKIISGVNFKLKKGEILGLAGLLGSGKSEFLKFLYGKKSYLFTGTIELKGKKIIPKYPHCSIDENVYYISKDRKRDGILTGMNITENSTISVLQNYVKYGCLNKKMERQEVNAEAEFLNIKMNSLQQPIETLSGGNQQKVLLGRGLLTDPELLLLDEPTRGIDVGAKEEIYNILMELASEGISLIISSSEIPELLRICDRILVFSRGKQRAVFNTSETNGEEILQFAFMED